MKTMRIGNGQHMRQATGKRRAIRRRLGGDQRGARRSGLAGHRDFASTRVGTWGAVLIGLLIVAFTAYGMTVGDRELLGKIWSLISGAAGAIVAWLGLRRT
jgi:hypothetical protein